MASVTISFAEKFGQRKHKETNLACQKIFKKENQRFYNFLSAFENDYAWSRKTFLSTRVYYI